MRTKVQSRQRFLRAYFAYTFLFDFMLCYAIYTALFELRGLSATQIGGLIAFWSATAVLLEVPSGALSDRFDRRWLLVAAPLVKALTFVCWGVADGSVWLYGLGFLCWSAGSALFSGTGEAMLYERLDADGEAHGFDRVLGQAGAAESIGIGSGLLLGGLVAAIDMELTVWLSIPPLLLCSLVAFALRDVRHSGDDDDEAPPIPYLENFRIAAAEFVREPALRTVTLYVACGLIVFEVLEEFEQLYYLAVQLPIWLYGVAGAAALGANALASVNAHRLAGTPHIAWSTPLLGGALFVLAAFGSTPVFVLVLLLAYVAVTPVTVLSEAHFQALQEGRSRATTTSLMVVAQNVVGIVVTIGFGVLADAVGIRAAYGWAGLTMVPLAAWTWWQQRAGRSPIG
jgi:MFS family permease